MDNMISEQEMKMLKQEELKILDHFVEFCDKNDLRYYLSFGTLLGAVRHKGFIPWDDDIDVSMPPEDYQKFLKLYKSDDKYFLQTYETDKYYHVLFAKIRENHTCMIEKENTYMNIHKGINIDIFPLIPYPDDSSDRKRMLFKFKLATLLVGTSIKTNKLRNKIVFGLIRLFPRTFINKKADKLFNEMLEYSGKYSEYKMELNDKPTKVQWYEKVEKMPFEDREYYVPYQKEEVLKALYGDYMKLPPESERVGHGDIILSFDKSYEELSID